MGRVGVLVEWTGWHSQGGERHGVDTTFVREVMKRATGRLTRMGCSGPGEFE